MLDQVTQKVSDPKISGKLGFAERDETVLARASTLVIQCLEEAGHEVDRFHAQFAHKVALDSDAYAISLRYRRSPRPLRQPNGSPCRVQLEVVLRPRFPDQTDVELGEMLLARILRDVLIGTEACAVEWRATGVSLDRISFLSVFAEPTSVTSDTAEQSTCRPHLAAPVLAFDLFAARSSLPVLEGEILDPLAPPQGPSRKTDQRAERFAPVEDTFGILDLECDRIIERRSKGRQAEFLRACRKMTRALSPRESRMAWALTAAMALFALPLGITAAAVHLMRGADVRFSLQMLLVAVLLLVMQLGELVNAALH